MTELYRALPPIVYSSLAETWKERNPRPRTKAISRTVTRGDGSRERTIFHIPLWSKREHRFAASVGVRLTSDKCPTPQSAEDWRQFQSDLLFARLLGRHRAASLTVWSRAEQLMYWEVLL